MLTLIGAVCSIFIILSFFNKKLWPWFIASAAAFPATVALLLGGGNGVVPFYLIAIVITGLMLIRFPLGLNSHLYRPRSYTSLILFVGWTLLVTLVSPTIFKGIQVLDPRGKTNDELAMPSMLEYSVSNVAQVLYLLLGVSVVFYLARLRSLSPAVPGLAFCVGTGVSFLALCASTFGLPWPTALLSNSPNVRYINYASDGITPRFRGIFAEPSAMALFSIISVAFFCSMYAGGSRRAKLVSVFGATLAIINLVFGAAGTAVAGGLMVGFAALLFGITRFILGRTTLPRGPVITAAVVVASAPLYLERLLLWGWQIFSEKIGSNSFEVRTASNEFSLDVLVSTYGVGAGLGSNRPNDFLTMLLSNVGIPGTMLFYFAMVSLIIETWKHPAWRPVAWALAAFFIVKSVSGANMSDPIMWLLVGVCAHVSWRPRTEQQPVGMVGSNYIKAPGRLWR